MKPAMVRFGGRAGGGVSDRLQCALIRHLLRVPDAVVISLLNGRTVRAGVSGEGELVWTEVEPAAHAWPPLIDELTADALAGDFTAQPRP